VLAEGSAAAVFTRPPWPLVLAEFFAVAAVSALGPHFLVFADAAVTAVLASALGTSV